MALPTTCLSVLRLLHPDLARDLRPANAGALTSESNTRHPGIPTFCFASVAPQPDCVVSDRFFGDLWRWTADAATAEGKAHPPPKFPTPRHVIAENSSNIPNPIHHESNDAVVNTDRQHVGEVVALVLADHADVLGRYRRVDAVDCRPIDPELLTSGARFGDTQFFRLIELVAGGIANLIQVEEPAPTPVDFDRELAHR